MAPAVVDLYRTPSQNMRAEHPVAAPQYVYVSGRVAHELLGADPSTVTPGASGRPFTGNPAFVEKLIDNPARNVVGILRGSDPVLRNEFVAIGAHNDHI